MEPRRDLSAEDLKDGPTPADTYQEYFRKARQFAEKHYWQDMVRIWGTKFSDVSPESFFIEYVWVVHATGFNAKVVAKMLPRLCGAYGIGAGGEGWERLGSRPITDVLATVLPVCNNPQKARAVHATASLMWSRMVGLDPADSSQETWERFKEKRLSTPALMTKLPYVGKITCHHLARNIGLLDSVKPDLHLVRLADHWGFKDCNEMCEAMKPPEMPLGIVDLILWYAASTFGTLGARARGKR